MGKSNNITKECAVLFSILAVDDCMCADDQWIHFHLFSIPKFSKRIVVTNMPLAKIKYSMPNTSYGTVFF